MSSTSWRYEVDGFLPTKQKQAWRVGVLLMGGLSHASLSFESTVLHR